MAVTLDPGQPLESSKPRCRSSPYRDGCIQRARLGLGERDILGDRFYWQRVEGTMKSSALDRFCPIGMKSRTGSSGSLGSSAGLR